MIDVVICVAELKSLAAWQIAGPQIIRRIAARQYVLIVPDGQRIDFSSSSPKEFSVIAESMFTSDFEEKLNSKFGTSFSPRRGWYVQQLIKLAALKSFSNSNRVLIWDADTVPLRNLSFFDNDGACRYYFGTEYHLPYFECIERLLGFDKAVAHSFIAQSFPITGSQIVAFFDYLEVRHSKPWWDAVIECIDFSEASGFSEYEALGTFVSISSGAELRSQSGSWSRDGNVTSVLRQLRGGGKTVTNHDFIAVEGWSENHFRLSKVFNVFKRWLSSKWVVVLGMRNRINWLRPKDKLSHKLRKIFSSTQNLQVVQIGANDGIQNDPIRRFLERPGSYKAVLIEPIDYYFNKLRELYTSRSDITILNFAVGSKSDTIALFHINPNVALEMNGDGPPNNWALGQGSSSRATVVYWIYKNSWRGETYARRIPEWISAIECVSVPVHPTRNLIASAENTLLIVYAQGMELEILQGLSDEALPRWVVIEEDLGKVSARQLLLSWGYRMSKTGSDTVFELKRAGDCFQSRKSYN